MNILQKAIRSMYSLTGSFNEKLLKYYKQYGATSSVLQDAEKQYLIGRLGAKYLTNQDYWKELDEQFGDGLPLEVSDILRKYGSDAHLYTFGPGVPILGPELVTSGTISLSAGAQQAVTGTTVVSGSRYSVSIPTGVLMALTSGWTITGNGVAQTVVSNGSGQAQVYSAGGVSNFTPSIREILGYSNTYSGFVAGNYFDSAGTTHASVDGSVGLVLDAAGSVGAELQPPSWLGYNAGLSSFNSFPTTATSGSAGNYGIRCPASLPTNKNLRVTVSWSGNTSGRVLKADAGGVTSQLGSAVSGTASYVFNSGATPDHYVYAVGAAAAGESFTITSSSIKEVPGIHATQPTPGYKPTLRKGIVNLLTWSNDLTNAAWSKSVVSITMAGENTPLGSTGQTLTSSGAFAAAYPAAAIPASAGQIVTMAFEVKAGTGASTASLVDESQGGTCYSQVTLATGATGATGFVTSATSVDLGNGWWLTTATYTVQAGKTSVTPKCWVGMYSGTSTAGQSIKVGRVGLFAGTLTAAQIIAAGGIPLTTTAPASSQAGVNYLEFDGVDDRLALGGPLFQMADDHCVVVGFVANSSATAKAIFSPAASSTTAACACLIWMSGTTLYARWRDDAGTVNQLSTNVTLGNRYVVAARKVGNGLTLRVNGATVATSTFTGGVTTLNTGQVANSFGYDTFHGNGSAYHSTKGTVSDADLLVLEKFVAQLSGVTL